MRLKKKKINVISFSNPSLHHPLLWTCRMNNDVSLCYKPVFFLSFTAGSQWMGPSQNEVVAEGEKINCGEFLFFPFFFSFSFFFFLESKLCIEQNLKFFTHLWQTLMGSCCRYNLSLSLSLLCLVVMYINIYWYSLRFPPSSNPVDWIAVKQQQQQQQRQHYSFRSSFFLFCSRFPLFLFYIFIIFFWWHFVSHVLFRLFSIAAMVSLHPAVISVAGRWSAGLLWPSRQGNLKFLFFWDKLKIGG